MGWDGSTQVHIAQRGAGRVGVNLAKERGGGGKYRPKHLRFHFYEILNAKYRQIPPKTLGISQNTKCLILRGGRGGQFAVSPGISTGTLPCTLSLYSSLPAFVPLDNLSNVYSDNLSNMCIFSFCQVCI